MTAKIIVFEGTDWSGKWTQAKLTKENLEKLGYKVHLQDFPRHGHPVNLMTDRYLNWHYGKLPAKASSIFYAVDRFDALFEIKKNGIYDTYDFIIFDRYTTSNMAHQWGKIKDDQELQDYIKWDKDLEYNIFGIPEPDKVILVTMSIENVMKNLEKKVQRDYIEWWNKDMHEADPDHLENARKAWLRAAEIEWWTVINCEKGNWELISIEWVNEMIMEEVMKI